MSFVDPYVPKHQYYVFATGVDFKAKYCRTRVQAENEMLSYCAEHGIKIELTEEDRHEKKYSDHHGCRFYINRV